MKIGNLDWNLSEPLLMGVLNITPDSFSDGGQFLNVDAALKRAEVLIQQGAHILDVGAESSRPGAAVVSEDEEKSRLSPFLSHYVKHFDTPLSLDTYKSGVAKMGLEHGVSMINDISGLKFDENMATVVAEFGVPLVVMHMLGDPKTMQSSPRYSNVVATVMDSLKISVSRAREAGVKDIIVDPGIGFGKTVDHNLALLRSLDVFLELGCPVLIGTSRKSFIGAITDEPNPEKRLEGTLVSNLHAYSKGVRLFRVHDVVSFKRALQVYQVIEGE